MDSKKKKLNILSFAPAENIQRRDPNDYKTCHQCGGKMLPCKVYINYKEDGVENLAGRAVGYKCGRCGDLVFTSQQAKQVEQIVRNCS